MERPVLRCPLPFLLLCPASGICVAAKDYDAKGPYELSVAPGDRIIILGRLASCLDWFLGSKESTGALGLVRTSVVEASGQVFR